MRALELRAHVLANLRSYKVAVRKVKSTVFRKHLSFHHTLSSRRRLSGVALDDHDPEQLTGVAAGGGEAGVLVLEPGK